MIEHVHLENVLAFRSVDIPLAGLTLLSGTNSAGKSSMLHCLALLRQSHEARTLPGAWMLNGDLVDLGTGRDLLHADPADLPGVDGVGMVIGLTVDGARADWVASYEPEADVLPVLAAPEPVTGGLFSPGFQYLKADRIVPAVTYPKSHEAVTVMRWLGPSGEHAPNFLRVHGGHPASCVSARHPDAVGSGLLDQANAWLDALSPGTAMAVTDVPGTDYVRLTFTRSGPDVRTEPHRSTNVGFGLTYALPVIVACLSATPGCLILVENPEAHLHPSGQALVGRLCAMASAWGAQVVVETHSDHVLNAVRLCVKRSDLRPEAVAVHFFAREDGVLQPELSTLEVSPDGMLPAWPSGFFDQWDQALGELLD
jgi:predicted ATPase